MKITRRNSRRSMALLLGGCAAIALPNLARADQTWDPSVVNGSWNTPANWLGGVLPGANDNATISFNDAADHTITYDGSYSSTTKIVTLTNLGGGNTNLAFSNNYSLSALAIYLGASGKASIQQSDGAITATNGVAIAGINASDVATYALSGGTLSTDALVLGTQGNGTFNQSDGTVLVGSGGAFEIGGGQTGTAHYELTGGTLIVNSFEQVTDVNGATQFTQSGGTHIDTGIGQGNGLSLVSFDEFPPMTPNALYLLSGGTLITNSENVGVTEFEQTGGVHKIGTLQIPAFIQGGYTLEGGELDVIGVQYGGRFGGNTQTGGTVNFGAEGSTMPSTLYDSYRLSGGVLNVVGSITVGGGGGLTAGVATFTQSGGTNNLGTASSPGNLYLAYDLLSPSSHSGAYLLSGDGVLNVIGSEYVGQGGSSTFLQSAGTQVLGTASSPSQLYVGYNPAAKGLYKLSAGTFLASGSEFVGYDGLGTFAVSGSGLHVLSGNMYLGGSDTLASATGKGTLAVSGGTLNISGTLKLWNSATASYSGGSMSLGGLDVGGGLFKMTAGKSRVLRTGSISTSSGGKVDLNDNSIIVDYPDGGPSQESSIASQIQNGYANGAWNGAGITSTVAASDPTRRIGYADNAILQQDSFSGEPVDHSSVLVKLTYGGDANLDGAVNIADLEALAQNWNSSGDWLEGDFDYNGTVDVNDLKILALNWNAGDSLTATEASLGLPLVVPEPSLTAFAVLVFCSGFNWQRKRKK